MSDMSEKAYEKSIVDRKKQEGTVLRSSFFLFFIATFWGNFYSNLCNRENKKRGCHDKYGMGFWVIEKSRRIRKKAMCQK